MKYLFPFIAYAITVACPYPLHAKEITAESIKSHEPNTAIASIEEEETLEFTKEQMQLLSQACGHMIGENIIKIGLSLDNNQILQGIQDALNGGESPLDEVQTKTMFAQLEEKRFRKECQDNLKAAEEFLAANAKQEDTVVIEENKLHFKQLKKGSGQACRLEDTPIVTYKGSYLNGETFGMSEGEKGEPICLKDTIIGLKKAIVGMKVGEIRKVHIHPDFAYGARGDLEPNALLTFEIALQGIEKTPEDKDESIGGMGSLPNEDAFADIDATGIDHKNLK